MKIAPCLLAIAVLVPDERHSVKLRIWTNGYDEYSSSETDGAYPKVRRILVATISKTFCTVVTPSGGHVVYCLEAYGDKISPKCAFELDEAELDLQEIGDELKEALHLCQGDIAKLCGDTRPGEGRISACLASNRASVSQSCVEAIEKTRVK